VFQLLIAFQEELQLKMRLLFILLIVGTGLVLAACGGTSQAVQYRAVIPTPTAPAGSVTVHLSPDGSGDYPDLAAALAAVSEGATFLLAAGTYYLPASLTISKPVRG
jgi:hypothetical protein